MPEKSSFFNHIEGDRVYNADDFAEYFNSVLTDGIFNGGENLSVYYGGTDRKARIKSGKAWIKGYFYHNTDDSLILEHDEADGTYDRIDRIVLRLDKNPESRHIKAFIKKGVPSVNPVAQEPTRDDMIYEISLAQVLVVHNTATIDPNNVKDERYDTNVCGLVNSLIQVDTAAMQQQFEDFISSLDEQMFETKDGAQNKADIAEANAKEYTNTKISAISSQMAELETKKVDKTAINDSVTSTNSTTVASSKAVKIAYDKGNHAHPYAPSSHVGAGGTAHAVVTTSANGFMSAADKSKLNGIEAGAKGDQTAGEILALLKTVDGIGSGLDADTWRGKTQLDYPPYPVTKKIKALTFAIDIARPYLLGTVDNFLYVVSGYSGSLDDGGGKLYKIDTTTGALTTLTSLPYMFDYYSNNNYTDNATRAIYLHDDGDIYAIVNIGLTSYRVYKSVKGGAWSILSTHNHTDLLSGDDVRVRFARIDSNTLVAVLAQYYSSTQYMYYSKITLSNDSVTHGTVSSPQKMYNEMGEAFLAKASIWNIDQDLLCCIAGNSAYFLNPSTMQPLYYTGIGKLSTGAVPGIFLNNCVITDYDTNKMCLSGGDYVHKIDMMNNTITAYPVELITTSNAKGRRVIGRDGKLYTLPSSDNDGKTALYVTEV